MYKKPYFLPSHRKELSACLGPRLFYLYSVTCVKPTSVKNAIASSVER